MEWKLWQSLGAIRWQCQQVTSGSYRLNSHNERAAWTGYPRTWHCWCGQCFCGNAWCLTKTKFYMAQWLLDPVISYEFSRLPQQKHKRNQSSHYETSIIWKLEEWLAGCQPSTMTPAAPAPAWGIPFWVPSWQSLVPSLAKNSEVFFSPRTQASPTIHPEVGSHGISKSN